MKEYQHKELTEKLSEIETFGFEGQLYLKLFKKAIVLQE